MRRWQKNGFLTPLVIIIFLGGVLISLFLFNLTVKNIENNQKQELLHLVQRNTTLIQRELDLNLQVLESLNSFYKGSEHISRHEFKEFVSKSLKSYKSIQALEWIPRIVQENRALYEKQARNDLNVDFNIKNKSDEGTMVVSGIKDEYFPVYYVEPLEGNIKALGFDLSSSPVRLKSLDKARSTRKLAVTKKITLVQEKEKQFAFLVFAPVWKKNDKTNLKGFTLGVYRVGDMVNAALNIDKINSSMLDIWIFDTTDEKNASLLFTNTNSINLPHTKYISKINLEGKTWKIYAKPSKLFISENTSSLPLLVLIVSFIMAQLITYIVASKVSKELSLKYLVKEKTKDLTSTNKKYEALLDMFDKKVIASRTDLKGNIIYTTSAFCAISGYTKNELIGQNHRIVRHQDMPQKFYKKMWDTLESGKVFRGEIKNKKKDGSFYWVDAVIQPEFDEKGTILSYFAIRDEITAKKEVVEFNKTLYKKVNEEVSKNQKKDQLLLQQSKLAAMGEMIGAIAHQWRQPLNTLAIQLQFIEDDYEDGLIDEAYLSKYSKESMKVVNFMSKTIDDFRNFFTVDKVKTYFDIKSKIEETTNISSAQLEEHNIKLIITGESFRILGHSSEFQQVILNLINNAKDALLEHEVNEGEIRIDIEAKEDKGCVRINDNAGGISQDIMARIFEPYFTTKDQGKGTGLGLYMSKMIIDDNMNGRLSVQNKKNGAEFIIELEVDNE